MIHLESRGLSDTGGIETHLEDCKGGCRRCDVKMVVVSRLWEIETTSLEVRFHICSVFFQSLFFFKC